MFATGKKGHRFVDRGDPTVPDFSTGDLGAAGTWWDLDLSSIIPKGSALVLLRVSINSTVEGKSLHIRTKGNSGGINVSLAATQVAGLTIGENFWIAPNVNGVVEYYFSSATWTTRDFTVGGWFK